MEEFSTSSIVDSYAKILVMFIMFSLVFIGSFCFVLIFFKLDKYLFLVFLVSYLMVKSLTFIFVFLFFLPNFFLDCLLGFPHSRLFFLFFFFFLSLIFAWTTLSGFQLSRLFFFFLNKNKKSIGFQSSAFYISFSLIECHLCWMNLHFYLMSSYLF